MMLIIENIKPQWTHIAPHAAPIVLDDQLIADRDAPDVAHVRRVDGGALCGRRAYNGWRDAMHTVGMCAACVVAERRRRTTH